MDPKQTPPRVDNSGITSDSASLSATGQSVFANPQNRFKDTNPQGDILIPASTPGKSRKPVNKPLLIGIITIVVLAIIAAIVAFVLPKGTGSGNKKQPIANSNLDGYIEYFVYGTEDENEVSSATFAISPDEYAVWLEAQDVAGSQEENEYYAALSEKINTLAAQSTEYSDQADLLSAFWLSAEMLDSNWLLDYYLDGNSEELKTQIDEFSSLDAEWGASASAVMNQYLSSEMNRFQVLSENNCIRNENITDTCFDNSTEAFAGSLLTAEDQLAALTELNSSLYSQLVDSLKTLYLGVDEDA